MNETKRAERRVESMRKTVASAHAAARTETMKSTLRAWYQLELGEIPGNSGVDMMVSTHKM